MRTAVVLVALVGASLFAQAAGQHVTLVQPENSGLSLVKAHTKGEMIAKFGGQVRVSGTFMGVWPAGATNRNYKEPDYLFVPDEQSSALLPHFILREPPYYNSYLVRSVTVTNGLEALKAAAGTESVTRLIQRRVNHVRVTGYFVLEDFIVGVECDAPWARAKLLKVELPEQSAMNHAPAPQGC